MVWSRERIDDRGVCKTLREVLNVLKREEPRNRAKKPTKWAFSILHDSEEHFEVAATYHITCR
jgi:hypothetical protein